MTSNSTDELDITTSLTATNTPSNSDADPKTIDSLNQTDNEENNDDSESTESIKSSMIDIYFKRTGPPQILLIIILMACGYGCVVSVVPETMTDRFARVNHGWEGDKCSTFSSDDEPDECDKGGDDAQNAAAFTSLCNNLLSFLMCPLFGALSDARGRRYYILLGLLISTIPSMTLVLILEMEEMSPWWYYCALMLTGVISWFAIMVASISDVIEPRYRTAAYGITSVGWGIGFSISPCLAVALTDKAAAATSFGLLSSGLLCALLFIPETLSKSIADRNKETRRMQEDPNESFLKRSIYRPFRDMKILNRNRFFRIMACVNCLSSMAFSAEYTLFVYYVEDELDFGSSEIAAVFAISGLIGIVMCGIFLKPLNDLLGERLLLVFAYVLGAIHDVLYGFAKASWIIFIGSALFGLTIISYPAIASIKANNVDEREQGVVQGALVSISSLAAGVGPLTFRAIYYLTEDTDLPGSMFLFGAGLFFVAGVISYGLPEKLTNARLIEDANQTQSADESLAKTYNADSDGTIYTQDDGLNQPLLSD